MKLLWHKSLVAFMILLVRAEAQTNVFVAPEEHTIPSFLYGEWRVGTPYHTGQVSSLRKADEEKLKMRTILYASQYVEVCGKHLIPKSIRSVELTIDDFFRNYDLSPAAIGLKGPKFREVFMEHLPSETACGLSNVPGTHVFLDHGGRASIEIEGDYFSLLRTKPGGSGAGVKASSSGKN
jgi:hypothetical protein